MRLVSSERYLSVVRRTSAVLTNATYEAIRDDGLGEHADRSATAPGLRFPRSIDGGVAVALRRSAQQSTLPPSFQRTRHPFPSTTGSMTKKTEARMATKTGSSTAETFSSHGAAPTRSPPRMARTTKPKMCQRRRDSRTLHSSPSGEVPGLRRRPSSPPSVRARRPRAARRP